MNIVRVALAQLPHPANAEDALVRTLFAIAEAGAAKADILCFPERYVPGYNTPGRVDPPCREISAAARSAGVAVILGTERDRRLTALVVDRDGAILGWQDKVQLDPSEEDRYLPGDSRRIFQCGSLTFGVAICHEAWRYPETVRWAARRGAHIVFHPHFHNAAPPSFHQHAAACRAAENTCYFGTVNCAVPGSATTTAIARPDGSVLAEQPAGEPGLLIVDIDTDEATCALAKRYKPTSDFMAA